MTNRNEGVLQGMLLELVKAQAKAMKTAEDVYVSHDRNGIWFEVLDDDTSDIPVMLINVAPDGSIRLVDNSRNCSGFRMYEEAAR